MKEDMIFKETVDILKLEKQNERKEFENKLNSINEKHRLRECELRMLENKLTKVKDENESYSPIVGPLYIKK